VVGGHRVVVSGVNRLIQIPTPVDAVPGPGAHDMDCILRARVWIDPSRPIPVVNNSP
jgi:hypothetical protein